MVLCLIISLLLLLYTFLIRGFLSSWKRFPDYLSKTAQEEYLTVIVPFYNEENNLENLFADLSRQDYPPEKYEVILVDDYSDDGSFFRAKTLCSARGNFRLIRNTEKKGKKYALKIGATNARGNYILLTDADCRLPVTWISTFGSFIASNRDSILISSAVTMPVSPSFSGTFQTLEFSSLVISGAASFIQQAPIMCNGANLAFKKSLILEAFSEMHPSINTGDDIFLMLYAKRKYPGKIHFIKNRNAFTSTLPAEGWGSLLKQRARWASKARFYRDNRLIYVSSLVFLTNLSVFLLAVLTVFNLIWGIAFLAAFSFKSLCDYRLLQPYLEYTGQSRALKFFLYSQLVYIVFIPVTAIAGLWHPLKRR